jgi:predicted nuclease with TOPRIM domain
MTNIDSMKRDLSDFARIIKEIGTSLLDVREIAESTKDAVRFRERIAELEAVIQKRNDRISQLVTDLTNANTSICKLVEHLRKKRDGVDDPHEDLVYDVARTLYLSTRPTLTVAEGEALWQSYIDKALEKNGYSKYLSMARAVLRDHGHAIDDAA